MHASRYAQICESLLKNSQRETGMRSVRRWQQIIGIFMYFLAVHASASWPRCIITRAPITVDSPVSFCDNRVRRERSRPHARPGTYAEKSTDVRADTAANKTLDGSSNRIYMYIRRFPPGKFITRLIEYRRMRSEKYYAWLESPACTRCNASAAPPIPARPFAPFSIRIYEYIYVIQGAPSNTVYCPIKVFYEM